MGFRGTLFSDKAIWRFPEIGLPPVILQISRWDFPVHKKPSSWLQLGSSMKPPIWTGCKGFPLGAAKVLGFQQRNLVLQDEEMALKFLHGSCHVILADFHRCHVILADAQNQGGRWEQKYWETIVINESVSRLTSGNRNLSVNWSTLPVFICHIYIYKYTYLAIFPWVSSTGFQNLKPLVPTAAFERLEIGSFWPSLRRGQHLKDACISTPCGSKDWGRWDSQGCPFKSFYGSPCVSCCLCRLSIGHTPWSARRINLSGSPNRSTSAAWFLWHVGSLRVPGSAQWCHPTVNDQRLHRTVKW